ncbi:MAG: S8 family serine peptidase [Candidatus Zixiibacteriota bacterium]|nr:MAG: S8 family serine peptidase [candidate division Zixibacteria bacterium]
MKDYYLDRVRLRSLMGRASGSPDVIIGLIDGPVDLSHPDFRGARVRTAKDSQTASCMINDSVACMHGTFVAGILFARRSSKAPAICPNCEIVLTPIFPEQRSGSPNIPSCSPDKLAVAVVGAVDAGVRIINLSLGLSASSISNYRELDEAFDYARSRGVIVVAATGNQASVGYLPLLQHPWVIPVAACDVTGRISPVSNIGFSIGRRGLMAPGVNITSTMPGGQYTQMSGTSVAAPFVTGSIALIWSEYPAAGASLIRRSVHMAANHKRRSLIPPILNVEATWKYLKATFK